MVKYPMFLQEIGLGLCAGLPVCSLDARHIFTTIFGMITWFFYAIMYSHTLVTVSACTDNQADYQKHRISHEKKKQKKKKKNNY